MIAGMKDTHWLRLNPLHPGRMIKSGIMDAVDDYPGMTLGAAAGKLGVSRVTLSRIVNGHAPVTVSMALKLETQGWAAADGLAALSDPLGPCANPRAVASAAGRIQLTGGAAAGFPGVCAAARGGS